MSSLHVTIKGKAKANVEKRIATGEYSAPAEYVSDLVLRDEQRRKHRALEELLLERLGREGAVEMNTADFKRIRRMFLSRTKRSKQS